MATFLKSAAFATSMCHAIKNDIDPQRISFFLGELAEEIFALTLPLPAIAIIGIVTNHDHHPLFVIEDRAVIRIFGIWSLPSNTRVFTLDAESNIWYLGFFCNRKHAVEN